jgi:hypothetical protein
VALDYELNKPTLTGFGTLLGFKQKTTTPTAFLLLLAFIVGCKVKVESGAKDDEL